MTIIPRDSDIIAATVLLTLILVLGDRKSTRLNSSH